MDVDKRSVAMGIRSERVSYREREEIIYVVL